MPDPSDGMTYPNRREEDQDVEMEPVVLGPGSYASPDPATESARLVPLDEHPLVDEISEDFGKQPEVAEEDAEETGEESEVAKMTVAELDDMYGGEEGYPADGKKSEKVAFAEAQEEGN